MRAVEISREFEIMRRAALRFKFDSNAESLKVGADAAARATALLQASTKATPSEDRRKIYNDLAAGIALFGRKLDALVEGAKKIDVAKSALFTVGDELTANTDRLLGAARLNREFSTIADSENIDAAMLLVRVTNWRFQATQDPQGPTLFRESIEKANSTIALLETAAPTDNIRSYIRSVKTSLATYQQAFDSLSTNAIETQNSGIPSTNSRVPSRGSTTQTRSQFSRERSSAVSSDSQPSPSRSSVLRNTASSAVSASVTGSCPDLYSAAISPGVKRANTPRASSMAAQIRSSTSA